MNISSTTCKFETQNEKCNNQICPIGIDTQIPVFSWQIIAQEKKFLQKSYRIIVSSDEEKCNLNSGDLWDTGIVESSEQMGIIYGGKTLPVVTRFWWKVKIWNQNQEESSWSNLQQFVTGFFLSGDWTARWFDATTQAMFVRKEFDCDPNKVLSKAYIFVAAIGNIANSLILYLNGEKIGQDQLFPGPTQFYRALYTGYDVTNIINPEKNALGIVITSKVSVLLYMQFSDGSKVTIRSDESWKCKYKGPYVNLPDLQDFTAGRMEEYDAREEFTGWNLPGFDDEKWSYYEWKGWWTGPVYLAANKVQCKIMKYNRPEKIIINGIDEYLVDFGQNISGFIKMNVQGERGTKVEIHYAETLHKDGSINTSTYTYKNPGYINTYTLKGEGREEYIPSFMYTGFRYVLVKGYPGTLEEQNILACFMHSDVLAESSFISSDPEINRIQSCAVHGFLSNLVNIPTDCPGRERRGWTADAFTVSQAQCINFDMLNFFYRWFDDYKDCQLGNGWIPVELPMSTVQAIDVIWPCASVLIPWDIYQATADEAFLRKYYGVMEKYIEFLSSIAVDGCFFNPETNICFGDWVSSQCADKVYIAAVYFYACVRRMADISDILGNREKQTEYINQATNIADTINERYLRIGQEVYYDNNSQSANAHALFFDVVPESLKERVLDSLCEKIQQDDTNTTGFLGTMCILEALAKYQRNDMVYFLVKNKNFGGWLYMILNYDLTTLAEDYDIESFAERYLVPASFNHAFLGGSISAWFYRYLAGIRPISPGYKDTLIDPWYPKDLKFVKGVVSTPAGAIESSWEKIENGKVKLTVSIPPNVIASVRFPVKTPKDILGNNIPMNEHTEINIIESNDDTTTIKIFSGSYSFIFTPMF